MIYDKESVYDTEISPHMAEIIKICQREGIPMAAVFAIKDDGEEGPLFCTTVLAGKDYINPDTPGIEKIKEINNLMFARSRSMLVTIRKGGGAP